MIFKNVRSQMHLISQKLMFAIIDISFEKSLSELFEAKVKDLKLEVSDEFSKLINLFVLYQKVPTKSCLRLKTQIARNDE
jgi:hypothetical protein